MTVLKIIQNFSDDLCVQCGRADLEIALPKDLYQRLCLEIGAMTPYDAPGGMNMVQITTSYGTIVIKKI